MNPLEVARMVAAGGLVVLTGRAALPGAALRAWPTRLRCWFLPVDEEATILGASPALEESMQRLKLLYFFLIGVKVDKVPLWGRRHMEVSLAARDGSAYASIVLHAFGAPASVYFYTPLKGGGMVFTRDYAAGGQVETANLSVRNVPSDDIEAVHRTHQERVAGLRARGLAPDVRASQAGRIAATHAFYASAYFRRESLRIDLPAWLSFAVSVVLLLWSLLAPALG